MALYSHGLHRDLVEVAGYIVMAYIRTSSKSLRGISRLGTPCKQECLYTCLYHVYANVYANVHTHVHTPCQYTCLYTMSVHMPIHHVCTHVCGLVDTHAH